MCNSFDPTWAISCLSVLLRAVQGRTDNCMTVIQLNDEEVSLFTDLYRIRRSCYRLLELSCFVYIYLLPFLCLLFYSGDFWPITTEFFKGVAVFLKLVTIAVGICFD
jgi:hypothetical protein